jgi:5-methylthioadenosine/S-adenosylhomocysteine deaminase
MEATSCDLLITDTTMLWPDMSLRDGTAIAVERGEIVAVDRSAELERSYHARTRLDGRGKVAVPGLVDAHTHVCQQLLRGRITDEPPMIWVRFLVPFESSLEPEDVYWSAMLSCLEMIKGGITSFADSGGRHMDQVARAVERMGLRACIARSTMDWAEFVPPNMKDSTADAIARTEELYEAWHGHANGRIHIWFALRQVMTSTPALVEGVADAAHRHGTGIHIHLAEHLREVEHCVVNYHKRPAEWLDSLGLLGPDVLAAHCVVLSDREAQLVVERGVTPVHCPRSNLHSHGFPKVPLFLSLRSPVGLGTDGASSNALDLFEQARLLKSATQARYGLPINDATVLPVQDALRMLTSGGARALSLQHESGTLEVGKKADIILIDHTSPHLAPTHNLLRTLLMCASPSDVSDVIVDGILLMRDRRLTQADEAEILAKASEHLSAVARRLGWL